MTGMNRKLTGFLALIAFDYEQLESVVAPKLLDADRQPLKQVKMWGALTPLNALQMTEVIPNRRKEPPHFRMGGSDLYSLRQ